MSMATFFAFGVKVALIGIFAQSWSNFDVVYQIITHVPESIGRALLSLSGLKDTAGLYEARDAMLSRMTEYGDEIGENANRIAVAKTEAPARRSPLFVTTTLPTQSIDSNSKARPPALSAERLANSGPLKL